MAIKTYKPTTNGRRGMTTLANSEITTSTPEKSLVVSKTKTGGRNNQGKMTVRHHGGGGSAALDIADRGATVVLFGVSAAEDRLSLSVYEAFLKELVIKTSYINPHTTQRAIDLLAEKPWSAEEIFSAELSMEEAAEELLHPAHSRRGKVLVKIGPR